MKSLNGYIGSAAFLFGATLLVNVGNYGLNVLLARWLGPDAFSSANLLATMVLLLSFIGMGLQLTVAKIVAEDRMEVLSRLRLMARSKIWLVVVVLLLLTPLISNYFKFKGFLPFVILFSGIPAYFSLCISRGVLQGKSDFGRLGVTYLLESFVRVLMTLGIIKVFEGSSAIAVSIGFLLSFLGVHFVYRKLGTEREDSLSSFCDLELSKVLYFMGTIMLYELSQILINNSDVLLVVHYFDVQSAGLYASLALLGRAVFFATWSVVAVLFPRVIEYERAGKDHSLLLGGALCVVSGLGLILVLAAHFFGSELVILAFGSEYEMVGDLVWIYAMVTTLFASANVFVYYNLSLGIYSPVILSCLAGIMQVIFIACFHESFYQVLVSQLVAISLLLVVLVFNHFFVCIPKYAQRRALPSS